MLILRNDYYIKACMKAWLLCESQAHAEAMSEVQRPGLIDKCRDCAKSCFALVCEIITGSEPFTETAFTCLLACRECYIECKKYDYEEDIDYCGEVCRLCGDMLKDLIVPLHAN